MPPFRLSVALLVLLGSLGCGKNDPAPTTKETKKDSTGTPTLPSVAATDDSKAAVAAAQAFLKAASNGQAKSADLSAGFRARLAPAELDADKAVGYSESGVRDWLGQLGAAVQLGDLQVLSARPGAVLLKGRFLGNPAGVLSSTTFLRMAQSEKAWLVDELVVYLTNDKTAAFRNEAAEQAVAAWAFADALAAGKLAKLEALLTPGLKAKLAPPLFDSDKELGFSRGKLRTALAEFSQPAAKNAKFELAGTVATFEAVGKKLELTLVPGKTPGIYLIDGIQLK